MGIAVGIIGAGQIAKDHCRNIAGHSEARLAAVADISRERREQLRDEFGMQRAYARWQDLVADSELDAVAIALPNSLHAPVTMAALEAGKHVLLDKPFALNYREAQQVVSVARRRRKLLMLGMNRRYVKDAQELRALVERGELGDVYHARASWMRRCGAPRFGTWFVNKKLAGGGCMLDIGVHMLDLAMHLMDNWKPAAVSGRVYSLFGPRGLGEGNWGKSDRNARVKFDVDDGAYAFIKFRNGATLDLGVAWVQHQEQPDRCGMELFGTEAGAAMSPLKLFRAGRRQGEYEVVQPQNVKLKQAYTNRQANWLDAILGRAQPLCTLEQALVVQRTLDAIYASSATGREVRLPAGR